MRGKIAVLRVLAGVLCFCSGVLAGPQVLEVSPMYLEFTGYEGGPNPAAQVVSIWNSGHGPMDWTVTEDCNWVAVEPNSGTSSGEVDDVNVAVDITGLSTGTYNCQLTVDAGAGANSPQIVGVDLTIAYDPNLVGWWKFDDGSGSTAIDSSGLGNDGTLHNGPIWTTGQIDGALDFDGINDYVEVIDPADGSLDFGSGNFTISLWFKTTDTNGELVDKSGGNKGRQTGYSVYVGTYGTINDGEIGFRVSDGTSRDLIKTNNTYNDGDWHHLAAVRTGTGSANLNIYVDGVDVSTSSLLDEGAVGISNSYDLSIGAKYDAGHTNVWENFLDGVIDEVAIWDRALTGGEIRQIWEEGLGGRAYNPEPVDGASGVEPNVVLSWSPGTWAADFNGHDVYFGTDYTDVNEATTVSAEYMGNQDTNSWATANYDPCGLKDGTWYYWRIDEVNGPNTWKGDVWSFETDAPFIELSATQFDFTAYEGGANPDDQILSISNSGGGTLNWEIVEDCNWLTVEPNTGSNTGETDDVNLSVDISGLVGGIHDCSLTISGSNASNSPQGVGVRLVVGIVGELYVPSEYPTIQYAIDVALDGAIVIVAPGTYTGADNKNLDFSGKAITVQSTNPEDPCVVGGTIIDCENSGRGFYFHSGEDANSIVAGLTVKNGEIQGTVSDYDAYGGGIHCSGASPTILKCRILSCRVYGYDCSHCGYAPAGEAYGGGISCISGSHPTIVDCEIRGNLARAPQTIEGWADAYGGGIFCSSDSTVGIYNCRITANTAHGGKWMSGASWISGARDSYGGGIYIGGSIGSNIKNCLITNNQTVLVTGEDYEGTNYGKSEGAGIFCENDVNVVNCTLVGNYTDPTQIRGDGGGIYGPSMVINSIIRGNLSPSQLFGTTSVTYSDIEGGFSGPGNIDSDPCFADPCGGDYHLKSAAGRWDANSKSWVTDAGTSPCIDAGDPNSDWTEELWPHGKQINMGAYGGTAEASMSLSSVGNIANLDNDVNDIVDGIDLGLFVEKWCYEEPLLAEDLDRDGFVNFVDFAIFASECSGVTVGETSISYQIDDCNMGAKAAVESEETRFTTTVVGSYIYFEDMMTANCCPDELFLEMDVDGNVITIYEREVLAMPCLCICDYPVTATLGPFEAGVYTLEVYEDYGGFIGSTIVTIGP